MNKADEKVMVSIRSREPLCEPFIRLSMIFKTGGIESEGYLGMCGGRIADMELIDGEEVRIDFINFPDMELTATGVMICRKILECYVPSNIIADAHEALTAEKKINTHINIISQTLREMNLYGLTRAFIKSDARIRRFVIAEICQRSIFFRCFRKMQNTYYDIFVRIKYHGLLAICNNVVAAYSGK